MKRLVLFSAALIAACGQQSEPVEVTFDPARLAAEYPDILVSNCFLLESGSGTAKKQEEYRLSCNYIAEKKLLGPNCVKMAVTGLQKQMDAEAAGRCWFENDGNQGTDDTRGVELRANEEELRACLANAQKCKRLSEDEVLLSDACASYVFWVSDDSEPLAKTEIFARDSSNIQCTLEVDYATRNK